MTLLDFSMDSLLEQNSHSKELLLGLKRKGAPQLLQVKFMDLNFTIKEEEEGYV